MPIDFICEQCGRKMRAPDGTGGRKARCPLCGQTQLIPGELPAASIELESPPPLAQTMGQSQTPYQHGVTLRQTESPGGSLAGNCLGAIGYGLSNFKSIFLLAVYAISVQMAFQLVSGYVPILGIIVAMLGTYIMFGILFRFYLDAVISSLEGLDEAPPVPPFEIDLLFGVGSKALGVLAVYVLPIVTLPLLPVAMIAMSFTGDMTGFDVAWVFRQTMKKAGQVFVICLFMLLWTIVEIAVSIAAFIGAGFAIGRQATDDVSGWLMTLLILAILGGVLTVINIMFVTVQFRCIGMLGRRNKDIIESMPEEVSSLKAAGYIIAGVVASYVMLAHVLAPLIMAV